MQKAFMRVPRLFGGTHVSQMFASLWQLILPFFRKLEFKRELDIVAVLAILISLSSIGLHGYNRLQGAEIKLLKPEMVSISHDTKENMTLTATMAHVNYGGAGQNGTLVKEYATFKFPDETGKKQENYRLAWQYFVKFHRNNKKGVLKDNIESGVHPLVVNAKGGAAHKTKFYARTPICDGTDCKDIKSVLPYKDFIKRVKKGMEIAFVLHADYLYESPKTVTCTVKIGDASFKMGKITSLPCY